ncbi:MAG: hypothetical protein LUG45_00885 [Clostridiales bacterium]|nr:hypothetical protein [Clostridiales bacterium]
MRRSLKAQIHADAKRVFLSMEGFAVTETIRYWNRGSEHPPVELHIPVVVNEDENAVRDMNKNQQKNDHERSLYQMDKEIFVALEDFQPPPKRNRRIQIGNHVYMVYNVSIAGGIIQITARELDE